MTKGSRKEEATDCAKRLRELLLRLDDMIENKNKGSELLIATDAQKLLHETLEVLDFYAQLDDDVEIIVRNSNTEKHLGSKSLDCVRIERGNATIDEIVYNINVKLNVIKSHRIKAPNVKDFLVHVGCLEERQYEDGGIYTYATKKGLDLGIVNVERGHSKNNHYYINLYNENAQRYIINKVAEQIARKPELLYKRITDASVFDTKLKDDSNLASKI